MSLKCIKCNLISFGEINRYILLIFVGVIIDVCLIFIENNSKFSDVEHLYIIIDIITYSSGLSLSFFLLIIYKIYNKRKNESKLLQIKSIIKQKAQINKKEKFLWILLISIIDFIAFIISCFVSTELTTWPIDIIFLALFSYLILKERLYKHHYLSMTIILILSLLYNIYYLSNYTYKYDFLKNNFLHSIFILLSKILFDFSYVLYKYYMIKKSIVSYEIMSYQGLIELVLSIISIIIIIKIGYIDNISDYYNNLDIIEIIIIISLIIIKFINSLSAFILIDKYSQF